MQRSHAPHKIRFASVMLAAVLISVQAQNALGRGNTWSAATQVSPVNLPDPTRDSQINAAAINANGVGVVAWDQFSYTGNGSATVGVATLSAGRWSAPISLSGSGAWSMRPSVAVGSDGTVAVSWTDQDSVVTTTVPRQRIQVAVRPVGAAAWTTYRLAEGPIGGVSIVPLVPLGVDGAGNVTAVWTLWDGTRHTVQTATLFQGQTSWDATTSLSGSDDSIEFSLAERPDGFAAVVYALSPYTTPPGGSLARIVTRTPCVVTCAGAWSATTTVVDPVPTSQGYINTPRVALDANGLSTIAWLGPVNGKFGVAAMRQLPGGNWTTPLIVITASNATSSYFAPDLASDGAGNAVLALSIFDASIGVDRASVWVSRGAPGGGWSAQQRLTDPTVPVDAYATRVAVSPDGSLSIVGWIDHYHGVVQMSQWTGSAWGPMQTVGRGTAFSSFQEVLSLGAASGSAGIAVWKNTAKGETRTMSSTYR